MTCLDSHFEDCKQEYSKIGSGKPFTPAHTENTETPCSLYYKGSNSCFFEQNFSVLSVFSVVNFGCGSVTVGTVAEAD